MADYDLGTAHGEIRITSDTTGVAKANAAVDGLKKNSMTAGEAIEKTGRVSGLAGLAIAGGLALAVKTSADFEQGLSNIAAVSGATGDQLDQLHDKALKIGADTAFGATEAASAMEELAKAGISVDDILNGAADATVALAAAGGVDMPTAATIASNAMNQFGLTAGDMVHTVDLIAGAANASAIDVTDLGMSMGQVGAVANLAGLSFDETATAIAEMGNAGIKGSDAGTSLKSMLMNLQPTTKAATAEMEKLGLITADGSNQFYDQQGNLKSLADIQGSLKTATEGLSEAQKTQSLETIFGSDAIRAAAIMADQGAEGYNTLNAAMLQTSAADVAKTRQDNLKGSIEQMKGAAETLAITVGEQLTPYIRGLADAVGGLLDWFNELSPTTQSVITGFLVGAAAFLLTSAAIIKTVLTVQKFMTALRALGILSTATKASWVSTSASMVAGWVKSAAAATANAARITAIWAAHFARMAVYYTVQAAQATASALTTAAVWTATAVKTAAQWLAMAAQATASAVRVAAAWVITSGTAAATAVASTLVAVATTVAGWISMAVTAAANAVMIAAAWFIALGPIGWAIAALIAVVAFIVIFWDDLKGYFSAGAQAILNFLQNMWTAVVDGWNKVIAFLKSIPGAIGNAFAAAGQWLYNAGKAVLEGLLNGIKWYYSTLWSFVTGIGGWILGAFSGFGSLLLGAGGDLVRGLWNGISGMKDWVLGKIKGFAGSIVSGIKGFFGIGSPSKVLADEVGKWLPPGIAVGLEANADSAMKAAEALATDVASSLSMSAGGPEAFWDGSSLGAGYVPPSREVASYAASQAPAGATSTTNISTTINNPVAEKASDSEARRLRTLSALGAF